MNNPEPIKSEEIRCECGAPKRAHYDGVQCPINATTWSANEFFEPINSVSPASTKEEK